MKTRHISNLINIGPKMTAYLAEIGIVTEKDLKERGVVAAWLELRLRYPKIMNRMALYALYGALTDQNCLYLPLETKQWLEKQIARHDR
jgi:hypothetical protein